MTKRFRKGKILLTSLLAIASFAIISLNTNKAYAEDKSFLEKYIDQVPGKTPYSKLPKEIQDKLKNVKGDSYTATNSYPFGQCTWYAWERSKDMGRNYDTHEGDGGEWYLDHSPTYGGKNVTVGDDKPVPQAAISLHTSYSDLNNFGWGFTTHIAYSEYIDSKGYLLASESNLDGNPSTGNVYFRIITPDMASKHGLKYVKPINVDSIKDWGKNPDGSLPKDSSASSSNDKEDSKDKDKSSGSSKSKANVDDTFTVNGYGSLTSKDFQEIALEDKVPTAKDLESMSSSQKQNLAEWMTDYNKSNSAQILKTSRVLIMALGYCLIIFTLVLIIAYAFDRVGVLEISMVEVVTGGNYRTTYTHEEARELNAGGLGVKAMNLKMLAIVVLLATSIFILVVTGKLYYYAYLMYATVMNIAEYMNGIRPK